MSAAGRNIVLCFDGTSNDVVTTPTNVLRICRCLIRDSAQLVYYSPGVGTLLDPHSLSRIKTWFRQAWDLASGYSLRDSALAAYTFLMYNYQPGDRLYFFGFSRGAYTARAVIGMLEMFGQLRPEHANLVPYLWQCYSNSYRDQRGSAGAGKLFQNAARYKKLFAVWQPARPGRPVSKSVPVEFAGLFDTVSSYLAPQPVWWVLLPAAALLLLAQFGAAQQWNWQVEFHWWYWILLALFSWKILFRWLPYTRSMPNAAHVRHAIALDEYRAFFPSDHIAGTVAEHQEVWFCGVHTDVGGGGKDPRLAKVALRWMLGEARQLDVRLDPDEMEAQLSDLELQAPCGKSMAWYWLLAGLVPQVHLKSAEQAGRDTGKARSASPSKFRLEVNWPNFWRYRYIREGDAIHASVAQRWTAGLLPHPRIDRKLSQPQCEELWKSLVKDAVPDQSL